MAALNSNATAVRIDLSLGIPITIRDLMV